MDLFTIWLGNTNPICRLCILSWIKLGYKPTIYVNLKEIDEFFLNLEDCISPIILDILGYIKWAVHG